MDNAQIKKIDEESLQRLTEGSGPSDECYCSMLSRTEESPKKGIRASIKRALSSISGSAKKRRYITGQRSVSIPLSFTTGKKELREKLKNNIQVTIERMAVHDVDSVDSEFSFNELAKRQVVSEPAMERRKVRQSLTDSAGEWSDGGSEWNNGED